MAAGIALLVISLGAVVAGRGYVTTSRRMRAFQTTRGTVIAKEPGLTPAGDRTEGRYGRGGGYQPHVTYTYKVDGVEYTHDRWGYAARGTKYELVKQQVAELPDELDVHYDPANPQEAYLVKHTPTIGHWLVAGGVIGVLFGLILILGSV